MRPAILALLVAASGCTSTAQHAAIQSAARRALAQLDGEITLTGLAAPVTVVRDRWGVPHISASSESDLFFAQGYVSAQDRLWQMEMWRRAAEGRLAEILGPEALPRDRAARLLKYRGPVDDRELTSYHPRARALMQAYVAGVNAFISSHGDRLPVEFALTGIRPEPWTTETLVQRQITFGDAAGELALARSVAHLGVAEANRRRNPDPWDELRVPEGIDVDAIGDEVLAAARIGGRLPPPAMLPGFARARAAFHEDSLPQPGSNNWVVSGAMSATGRPVVVNDPHREVTLPSLRYLVHLTGPGWNVIGAVEPPFFGVAIGHNERLAWGLTIVGTDQQDVYVEELNPSNPNEAKWRGSWEPLHVVREEIRVKGGAPEIAELKFSRHGPIFHEDRARHRAYALRSALHEPGTAPYLAALRLAQTRTCREFIDASQYWNFPSENLICGDVEGNIAWRASALTPSRGGWTGRLPVPGTGTHEWTGFRTDLPQELNPPRGFIVTANHNVQPKGYAPPFMFKNADTRFDRITRLLQLLEPGRRYSLDDHRRMQLDAFSRRASADVARFRGWTASERGVERARQMLASWDAVYRRDSAEAAIYEVWRRVLGGDDDPGNEEPSRAAVERALAEAVESLTKELGENWRAWRWGRIHARPFPHPFVRQFDLPPVERPGGAGTVAADGASFREILDVGGWDGSLVTNTPGQSGQPGSPFYANLLPLWAKDEYFPLSFSPQAIERAAAHRLVLRPPGRGGG
jgi:penicillin amidase